MKLVTARQHDEPGTIQRFQLPFVRGMPRRVGVDELLGQERQHRKILRRDPEGGHQGR